MIYFDNAATTLIKPQAVTMAMANAVKTLASPGRGGYPAAAAAAEKAYACREEAARLFNVPDPSRVVFTLNATHALNIAIKSLATKGDRVVISGYEHNSVFRPLGAIGAEAVVAASPLFDSEAAAEAFEDKLTSDTRLAVVNYGSNVLGFILPVQRISELCRRRRIPLIIDASQAAGVLPVDFEALAADFIAMPGHKSLYGPQGTGLLICSHEGRTLIEGGSGSDSRLPVMPDYLPDRLEAGTHNMPGIAGLLEGLRFVRRTGINKIRSRERFLLRLAEELLEPLDEVELYAAEEPAQQAAVLSFNVRGVDCQEIAEMLAGRGIAVRAGVHCAPRAHKSAGTEKSGTVRMSFSYFNNEKEVREFVRELKAIIYIRLRQRTAW